MPKDYAKLGLSSNPFDVRLDRDNPGTEPFIDRIRARELQRVLARLNGISGTEEITKIWIIKDEDVSIENNISVLAKLFLALDSRGFHSAYAALPLIYQDPLRGFYRMIVDKMQAVRFKEALYSFITGKIHEMPEEEQISEAYHVRDLLATINTRGNEALDDIFHPLKPESKGSEPDEYNAGVDDAEAMDPTDEEMRASIKGALINKVFIWLEERGIKNDIQQAALKSLEAGFEEGFQLMVKTGNYRDNIASLMNLLTTHYEKVVLLLDQLEGWDALDDKEQGKLLGAISEFSWSAGKDAIIFLACSRESKERLEKHVGTGVEVILRFEPVLWFGNRLTEEQARKLIADFLTTDKARIDDESGSIAPFTKDSVKWIAEREWQDLYTITEVLKNSLDFAAVKSLSEIDGAVLAG